MRISPVPTNRSYGGQTRKIADAHRSNWRLPRAPGYPQPGTPRARRTARRWSPIPTANSASSPTTFAGPPKWAVRRRSASPPRVRPRRPESSRLRRQGWRTAGSCPRRHSRRQEPALAADHVAQPAADEQVGDQRKSARWSRAHSA
jgi:hypothetical protein